MTALLPCCPAALGVLTKGPLWHTCGGVREVHRAQGAKRPIPLHFTPPCAVAALGGGANELTSACNTLVVGCISPLAVHAVNTRSTLE